MDRRYGDLHGDQSIEDLEKRGAEQMAFIYDELQRLRQQVNDSVIEARQRVRSMQAAKNDLSDRLKQAGMGKESRLLLMDSSVEALERAALLLSQHEQQQDQRSQAMQQALTDFGVRASPRQHSPQVPDQDLERIERLLVQLELLDDSAATTVLRTRLDSLDDELNLSQRRLRLDSLALDVSHAVQVRKETEDRLAILNELEAQLGVYEVVPDDLLLAIASIRDGKLDGSSLRDLQEAVMRWCEQEAQRLDGERIRSIVLGSLRELGYDVREGMQTAWVEGSSIVLQKAGSGDYGVELKDFNGRLRSQVIRYGDPNSIVSDQQHQRDTEIEQHWCSAHAKTLAILRQQGMEARIMAKREPGEVPLVVVRSTKSSHADRDISRTNQPSKEQ